MLTTMELSVVSAKGKHILTVVVTTSDFGFSSQGYNGFENGSIGKDSTIVGLRTRRKTEKEVAVDLGLRAIVGQWYS